MIVYFFFFSQYLTYLISCDLLEIELMKSDDITCENYLNIKFENFCDDVKFFVTTLSSLNDIYLGKCQCQNYLK